PVTAAICFSELRQTPCGSLAQSVRNASSWKTSGPYRISHHVAETGEAVKASRKRWLKLLYGIEASTVSFLAVLGVSVLSVSLQSSAVRLLSSRLPDQSTPSAPHQSAAGRCKDTAQMQFAPVCLSAIVQIAQFRPRSKYESRLRETS